MAGHDEAWAGTHNEVSGGADSVVQARDVQGGIHVHQARTMTWPVPRQLPPDIAHFTGRDAELARLDALLKSADSPVTAIAGAGGMGKTSLAVRWAHRARERFPDGELCVNLRGFDPGDPVTPEQALDRFLRALDVPGERIPHSLDERADLYRSLVAGRRMLVLLDNAANVQQVRPLLPGSPTCLVIVTSRSQLTGLLVREGAQRVSLDVLSPREAMSLLRQVIGAARTEKEREKVAELARRCAYLPLALRIAAERVAARPHLALADLVEELADDSLEVLAAADDETTQVRTVFSWSYRALSAEAGRIFRLLGLHPGPTSVSWPQSRWPVGPPARFAASWTY